MSGERGASLASRSACTCTRRGAAGGCQRAPAGRPRPSGARLQALARFLVARAPGRLVARGRAEARGVAAGAQLQPQARLRRAGQVLAPARACQARSRASNLCWAPDGIRAPQDAGCGGSRAHSVHQQPTGRSAGVCRRRSSRLTSDRASAAMPGASSASKRAMAAVVVSGLSVLVGRDCAALLASYHSSLACADVKTELLGPAACMHGAGSVR